MTRPQPPAPAALASPTPAASPGAGVAGHPWPQFKVRAPVVTSGACDPIEQCAACRMPDFVDDATRLCKPCWRVVVLLAEVLRDMRDGER